jgi:hypothetical protein
MKDSIRFTKGTSAKNPPGVNNVQNGGKNNAAEPKAKSFVLQSGSTMAGMPGFIKTNQGAAWRDSARGGKGVGPHREGPIGKRGSQNGKLLQRPGAKAAGTMEASYKSKSMGAAGTEARNDQTGRREGHAGRMEKLSARSSFEGGRKRSSMY